MFICFSSFYSLKKKLKKVVIFLPDGLVVCLNKVYHNILSIIIFQMSTLIEQTFNLLAFGNCL